jgi:hypothetical protein
MHMLLGKGYIVYMSLRRSYVSQFAQFAKSLNPVVVRVHISFLNRAHRGFESD